MLHSVWEVHKRGGGGACLRGRGGDRRAARNRPRLFLEAGGGGQVDRYCVKEWGCGGLCWT